MCRAKQRPAQRSTGGCRVGPLQVAAVQTLSSKLGRNSELIGTISQPEWCPYGVPGSRRTLKAPQVSICRCCALPPSSFRTPSTNSRLPTARLSLHCGRRCGAPLCSAASIHSPCASASRDRLSMPKACASAPRFRSPGSPDVQTRQGHGIMTAMPEISRFFGGHQDVLQRPLPGSLPCRVRRARSSDRDRHPCCVPWSLPRRALALVLEWASLHRAELKHDWELLVMDDLRGGSHHLNSRGSTQ